MGAAWCVSEADDLVFNKCFQVRLSLPSLKYVFPNYFQLFPVYLTFFSHLLTLPGSVSLIFSRHFGASRYFSLKFARAIDSGGGGRIVLTYL
jgi:hypothetical protein